MNQLWSQLHQYINSCETECVNMYFCYLPVTLKWQMKHAKFVCRGREGREDGEGRERGGRREGEGREEGEKGMGKEHGEGREWRETAGRREGERRKDGEGRRREGNNQVDRIHNHTLLSVIFLVLRELLTG